ncbi:MAG: hypothetical protein ACU0AT_13230 [Tranquillimonas sp.]
MPFRWALIESAALTAMGVALSGIGLYAASRPAETGFRPVEASAGYVDYAGSDLAAAAVETESKYQHLNLGRMVVRQEGAAATTYWAINFNVWSSYPVAPDSPEKTAIREAVFEALAAVMEDAPDARLSVRDIRNLVAAKVAESFPNLSNLTVQDARRSEVGRT